jgi:hypothetical protein
MIITPEALEGGYRYTVVCQRCGKEIDTRIEMEDIEAAAATLYWQLVHEGWREIEEVTASEILLHWRCPDHSGLVRSPVPFNVGETVRLPNGDIGAYQGFDELGNAVVVLPDMSEVLMPVNNLKPKEDEEP